MAFRILSTAGLVTMMLTLASATGAGTSLQRFAGASQGAQRTHSVFPELTRPVNDFAHVIDAANAAALESTITSLLHDTGDVVIVATLESCGDAPSIKACSMTLFENHGRGIGQAGKDNGVLLLAVPSLRQARITTGSGIERIVTDDEAASIVATMIDSFRAGRYGEGFRKGVDRIVASLRQARGNR